MAVETITSSALRAMSDVDFDKLIAQLSACSVKKYGAKAKVQPRIEKKVPAQLFDISDYADDASKITMRQQMQQANWSDIQAAINVDLRATQIGDAVFVDVEAGAKYAGKRHADIIIKNMKEELDLYRHYLAGDTLKLFDEYIDDFHKLLKRGGKKFSHIDASTLNEMSVDSVKKIIMQEIESNRQQFKDHGIRHIMNNIKRQREILDLLKKSRFDVSQMDYLQGQFIMVNHDVGYTTPLTRAGGLRGVIISRNHPAFSARILREQKELWDVGKIFSEAEYKKILRLVATHDATELSMTDPLALATRLSDNLGLYSAEKLPGMFRYVDNGEDLLVKLGFAAKADNKVLFGKIKRELEDAIDKTARFSAQLKRDLKAGVQQIDYTTPKFTMGVLGGDATEMYSTTKSWVVVDVAHNKWDQFLTRFFDMGQKQAKKMIDSYGGSFVDNVLTLGEYKGRNILEIRMLNSPIPTMSEATKASGLLTSTDSPAVLRYAKKYNLSYAKAKKEIEEKLGEVLQDASIWVRQKSDVLEKIIKDGRMKTQFETGTSSGLYDPAQREALEKAVIGLTDVAPRNKPIYGYLTDDTSGLIGKHAAARPMARTVHNYGDIAIKLKPKTRSFTTFTMGDSLDSNASALWKAFGKTADKKEVYIKDKGALKKLRTHASSVDDPKWYAMNDIMSDRSFYSGEDILDALHRGSFQSLSDELARAINDRYIEAQIHGGVTLEDISEIVFPDSLGYRGLAKLYEKIFSKHNITVTFEKTG